ncbi:FMN-dependent NADH-azoreductase [Desulfovibrio sp. X2]|uniref:FMN-dependent NADH-azoreductase n=1 Tax=Desulfovibrio sp. X2 TaxID=941449 RepID=UPI000358A58F|nr:NAD(P)H-dependent oxidoreductase [Desulfovibrio sp. X2]EPR38675.1 FMN-dependent NADH-azoreductase [Desulfovibrio sp. X2]
MSRVLYLKASPRARSHSVAVADAFVEAYKAAHPSDEVVVRDLFRIELPPFDGATLQGKYNLMHGRPYSEEEEKAWTTVTGIIEDFASFGKYVLAVPMWNFMIPYRLKQFIDIICQPTLTFLSKPDGSYEGLLKGKRCYVSYARGGVYPPDSPADNLNFQARYLEFILGFMGITDVRTTAVEGTLAGPEVAQANHASALEKARTLAATF